MAAITRRTWAQMRSEVQRRLGGLNQTGADGTTFASRAEYFLWASYMDLATTFHHFELDMLDTTTLTLSTTANTLPLPADTHEIVAMSLRDPSTDNYLGEVGIYSVAALAPAYNADLGRPTKRVRFGTTLYFDKLPDLAYKVDLYYYRRPAAPDFSASDSPETAVEMDEHIIEGALAIANPAIGRPEFGTVSRQLLTDWLAVQVRPSLLDPLEQRERMESARTIAGAQG